MTPSSGSSPLARGLPRPVEADGEGLGIIPARAGFTRPGSRGAGRRADHPRSRGVYAACHPAAAAQMGSSPLARGLPCTASASRPAGGIIPARAGFTHPDHRSQFPEADHPRSRGVYPPGLPSSIRPAGSSPLARGLLVQIDRSGAQRGIIPARAGFTSGRRICGWAGGGSSPLARGLLVFEPVRHQYRRIIPARAGFTAGGPVLVGGHGDHPRSRGVYRATEAAISLREGSSPLARGLRGGVIGGGVEQRIIPARAGFTRRRRWWRSWPWDHPRSRGVYPTIWRRRPAGPGSSPLARGLLESVLTDEGYVGIIPARAGFTAPARARTGPASDHPRSRGVYGSPPTPTAATGGSSPLARGLHRLRHGR